jgi:DNA mismatch repair protein MutL
MMGVIRRLPSRLINQIAAGEVVERPASVVKELVENALDAQAAAIRVQCHVGGTLKITVIDDGKGMSREDALLCVERHATSKLPTDESLFAIDTKGFRGEAIPSIASVSKMRLETSEAAADVGTRISIVGGDTPVVEPCAPTFGTRVDVDELFFNVPARRKFLKREATELLHCQEAVIRLALAHVGVSFFFEHNDRVVFAMPARAQALEERLAFAVGAEVNSKLLRLEERRLGVTVSGLIAAPEFNLSTARGLYTFVNHRYVRDRGLLSGISRAFQEQLPPGRQPAGAIFIEVAPESVDVNVHPQKLEVRFADSRQVVDALVGAIGSALKQSARETAAPALNSLEAQAHYAQAVNRFLKGAAEGSLSFETLPEAPQTRPSFGTARADLNSEPPPGYFSKLKFLGDLAQRYWVCEGPGASLVVVDPPAVKQRLAYAKLRSQSASPAQSNFEHFAPRVLTSTALSSRVLKHTGALLNFQIAVDAFGADSAVVRTVPEGLYEVDVELLLSDLLEVLDDDKSDEDAAWMLLAAHAGADTRRTHTHDDSVEHFRFAKQRRVVVYDLPLLELEAT